MLSTIASLVEIMLYEHHPFQRSNHLQQKQQQEHYSNLITTNNEGVHMYLKSISVQPSEHVMLITHVGQTWQLLMSMKKTEKTCKNQRSKMKDRAASNTTLDVTFTCGQFSLFNLSHIGLVSNEHASRWCGQTSQSLFAKPNLYYYYCYHNCLNDIPQPQESIR